MQEEISYLCDQCGEEIVIPIDISAGSEQDFVEDCPVCCCPHELVVTIDRQGKATVTVMQE